jgi:hypothetical protein
MNFIKSLLHHRFVRRLAIVAVSFVALGVAVDLSTRNDWREPSPPGTITLCLQVRANRADFDATSRIVSQEFDFDRPGDEIGSQYGALIRRGSIRCTRSIEDFDKDLAAFREDAATINGRLAGNHSISYDVLIVDDAGRDFDF